MDEDGFSGQRLTVPARHVEFSRGAFGAAEARFVGGEPLGESAELEQNERSIPGAAHMVGMVFQEFVVASERFLEPARVL